MSITVRPQVQALEGRQLLSATSPLLTTIHVNGSVHKISGIVLSFDESLSSASATNANSYIFGKVPPQNNDDNGISLGDVLGLLSRHATSGVARPGIARPAAVRSSVWVKLGKIQWRDVTYNDTTHSVTLTAVKAFNGVGFFRMLRVRGTGQFAVEDNAGHPFAGGNDGVMKWTYRTGKVLHYTDKDGDRVTLQIKGAGTMSTFLRRNGEARPIILISGTNAKSSLTGKIIASARGDGSTVLEQLSGSKVKNNVIGNGHFLVIST